MTPKDTSWAMNRPDYNPTTPRSLAATSLLTVPSKDLPPKMLSLLSVEDSCEFPLDVLAWGYTNTYSYTIVRNVELFKLLEEQGVPLPPPLTPEELHLLCFIRDYLGERLVKESRCSCQLSDETPVYSYATLTYSTVLVDSDTRVAAYDWDKPPLLEELVSIQRLCLSNLEPKPEILKKFVQLLEYASVSNQITEIWSEDTVSFGAVRVSVTNSYLEKTLLRYLFKAERLAHFFNQVALPASYAFESRDNGEHRVRVPILSAQLDEDTIDGNN